MYALVCVCVFPFFSRELYIATIDTKCGYGSKYHGCSVQIETRVLSTRVGKIYCPGGTHFRQVVYRNINIKLSHIYAHTE